MPEDGAVRARQMIRSVLDDRYAGDVSASATTLDGIPAVRVRVRAEVPALGLFGPAVPLDVRGHAVQEVAP